MAWRVYKEYTDLNFSRFSMSFDFVLGENQTLGIGYRERTSVPTIRNISSFGKNMETNFLISSSPDIFAVSKIYTCNNNIITRNQLDNTSFFNKGTRIVNNKVYEEVVDLDNFEREKYNDYFVENNVLYVYYPGKYTITNNGRIGMPFQKDKMSFVFSSANGNTFDEQYFLDETFRTTKYKTRISISNNGKLVNISQKKDNFFSSVLYIQFPQETEHGFIFAGAEAPDGLNTLMQDLCVFGTKFA